MVVAELTLEVAIGFTDSASTFSIDGEVDGPILTRIGASDTRKVPLGHCSDINIRIGLRLRRGLSLAR